MKKFIALAAMGVFVAPAFALAATYQYIALDGTVQKVEATSASEALVAVDARDNSIHSGVVLDTGTLEVGEQFGNEYTYVAVDGSVKTITAASIDAAMVLATDRMATSGFMVE